MLLDLIMPVPVVIEPVDKTIMVMDDDAREPVHGATSSEQVTIQAQVSWTIASSPMQQISGTREDYQGYIVVREADLALLGKTIKRGDRIVQIGSLTYQNLFVLGNEPIGHWSDLGGHSFRRFYFSDREPGR